MMSDKLIVAWRKQNNQQWFIVGFLTREQNEGQCNYIFHYTQGVKKALQNGFSPIFGEDDSRDLSKQYFSNMLFPVFSNRLMTKSRPEYPQYKDWLELEDEINPLIELMKSNGVRATDGLQLFGIPKKENDKYIVDFFIHKSNLIPTENQKRLTQRSLGEKLYLSKDIQNPYDKDALIIRAENPLEILGYAPRIYTQDFCTLLNHPKAQAKLSVKKLNPQAPLFYRVLCRFEANWIEGFVPFDSEDFRALSATNACL